jgi:methionyl-tRNA formyltransferase
LAAGAIAKTVDSIARGEVVWTQQQAGRATTADKLDKRSGILDLREDARSLARRIHALSPRPGASLRLIGDEREELLKVSRAEIQPFEAGEGIAPGSIDRRSQTSVLRIATGEGWLLPLVLQRAGAKALPVAEFLRGYALPEGARFDVESSAARSESQ